MQYSKRYILNSSLDETRTLLKDIVDINYYPQKNLPPLAFHEHIKPYFGGQNNNYFLAQLKANLVILDFFYSSKLKLHLEDRAINCLIEIQSELLDIEADYCYYLSLFSLLMISLLGSLERLGPLVYAFITLFFLIQVIARLKIFLGHYFFTELFKIHLKEKQRELVGTRW